MKRVPVSYIYRGAFVNRLTDTNTKCEFVKREVNDVDEPLFYKFCNVFVNYMHDDVYVSWFQDYSL